MDLEAADSKSARPDNRRPILHAALLQRRAELRKGWRRFITAECLKQLDLSAAKVSSFLSGPDSFHDWRTSAASSWTDCHATLPECLLSLGLGETIAYRPSIGRLAAFSCADLRKLAGKDRVEALRARYRCPLNIGVETESAIAEELLRQLMVVDRSKLEAESEFDVDEVLLKLNLTAICAPIKRDLRFLDALNYFYELPQRSLGRLKRNPPLLAAWLCLYAQLLCATDW